MVGIAIPTPACILTDDQSTVRSIRTVKTKRMDRDPPLNPHTPAVTLMIVHVDGASVTLGRRVRGPIRKFLLEYVRPAVRRKD
jgi:hypothetical protein